MNKKQILKLSAIAIFLIVAFGAVKFISDAPFRNKLPKYPDFKSISKPLQDQISEAGRKAYLNPTIQNLGNLGLVYHSAGFSEKAVSCYQLAIEKSAKDRSREWTWSYYLGCLYLEQGESKLAIENFKEAMSKNPGCYQALFYTGEAYKNLGYTEQATNIFKRVAGLNETSTVLKTPREFYFPVQIHAAYNLASVYLNSNQTDSAEAVLKDLINQTRTFGPAYRLLGEVFSKKGEQELAKKYMIRSNDFNNNVPYADTLLDKVALISRSDKYLLKQIETAKRSYNFTWEFQLCAHAMKYIPENKILVSDMISLYIYRGKEQEVLPLLDQHLKNYSDDFDEILHTADLLYGKQLEPQAMKFFEQAKKIKPESSRLALWLLEKGKKNEAVTLINAQLEKNPGNEQVMTDAVHLFVSLGEKERAGTLLSSLRQKFPKNIEAKKADGLLLEMAGDLKQAIPLYEEAAKEKDLSIIKYLATIYLKDKKWDKAIQDFKLGLENFPNETDLLEPLGRLLISCPDEKLRDIEAGKEYSERAYFHFNSPVGTRILAARNLATAYAMTGDKQMAANYMNITMNMIRQINVNPQEYLSYFEMLKQQYKV